MGNPTCWSGGTSYRPTLHDTCSGRNISGGVAKEAVNIFSFYCLYCQVLISAQRVPAVQGHCNSEVFHDNIMMVIFMWYAGDVYGGIPWDCPLAWFVFVADIKMLVK